MSIKQLRSLKNIGIEIYENTFGTSAELPRYLPLGISCLVLAYMNSTQRNFQMNVCCYLIGTTHSTAGLVKAQPSLTLLIPMIARIEHVRACEKNYEPLNESHPMCMVHENNVVLSIQH